MSVQIGYKKQFLFGILFVLIILLFVEILFRTYEYITIPCTIFENDAYSNLNYIEKKTLCYDTNTVVVGKAPLHHIVPNQHKFTIHINSDGFRGPEINIDDPSNYRIFLTGGSTAFGFGSTSDKTTITGYLQTYFDNEYEDLNIEIVNAGIFGADAYREILFIKEKLIEYNPNMIISYTGVNDSGGHAREIALAETVDNSTINYFKFGSHPWYRTAFVINKLISQEDIGQWTKPESLSSEQIKKFTETFRKNWSQSCNLLKDNEITSVLIVQPVLATKKSFSDFEKKTYTYYGFQKPLLENYAKQLKLLDETCDYTFDFLNAIDYTSETIYTDNTHLNDLGNKIVAEKIYQKILPIIKNDIQKLEIN